MNGLHVLICQILIQADLIPTINLILQGVYFSHVENLIHARSLL